MSSFDVIFSKWNDKCLKIISALEDSFGRVLFEIIENLKVEIEKLNKSIGGIVNLNKLPEALFVVDLANESTAITEAKKLGIPVIGLADSNVDPEGVEIVVPGNDDAIRSIELITSAIADACLKGSGKRAEVENKENS